LDGDKKIGNLQIKAGIRAEYTQTKGYSISANETHKNDYLQFFPTFYATYPLGEQKTISFNYGRRIQRPSYILLNPFPWYSGPYNYTEGNPFLKPSFNNNLELSYTHKDWLVSSLYMNLMDDGYSGISEIDLNSNFVRTTQKNFLSGTTIGLSNSVSLKTFNWLENNNQFQVYHTRTKSSNPTLPEITETYSGSISSNNTATLNRAKTLFVELGVYYQFPQLIGYTKSNAYYSISGGVKAQLLEKKLILALNASDIFKTFKPEFSSTINGVHQIFSSYPDYRNIRITVTYNLWNSKARQKRTNQKGNEEEARRL